MLRYFEINENGHNIRCKLRCNDIHAIEKTVIFVHGFGGHKDNGAAETLAERMLSKYRKTALICFNLPCHGDDVKKKLSLDDCITYLDLVVGYAEKNFGPQLYACATSFGGYVLLTYLMRKGNPFRRIVLRCPAVNMYEAITGAIIRPEELEKLNKGKDVLVGFDRKVPVSPAFLEQVRRNDIRELDYLDYAEDICILHGNKDEIIAFEESKAFADNNLMEFVEIDGADHRFRDPRKMDLAVKHILMWYQF